MTTKVSFVIQLKERFLSIAKKIKNSTDGLTKSNDELCRRFKKTDGAAKRVSKRFQKLGKDAKALARQIKKKLSPAFGGLKSKMAAVVATVAGGLGFSKLISEGAAFQDAIADLASITGTTGKELEFLSNETLRLAKSSSIAQVEVARAFKEIASAKSELLKDPKGLSIVTEQALLLANAAGISVPDAVRASVGALNQFNKGAEDAARFVNVLAAGAKIGASTVADTAEALKNGATVAAQFRLSFEQTNAILQVFSKSGLKAGEAGTALRGVLIKLEQFRGGQFAPSKIGIIKSLKIIKKLGLTNIQVSREFGTRSLQSILILRKQIPLIAQWTKELTGTNVAQQQAAVRLATFNQKVGSLGISINDALIKVFLRLEPVIKKEVLNLTDFFDTLDPQRLKAFADELGGLVKLVGLLGKGLGLVASVFTGVGTFIGEEAGKSVEFLAGRGGNVAESKRLADQLAQQGAAAKKLAQEKKLTAPTPITGLTPKIGRLESPILTNKSDILATLEQQKTAVNLSPTAPIINLERDRGAPAKDLGATQSTSKTTVDVNIRAPKDVVKSVQTRSTGQVPELNMGVNMVVAT